MDDQLRVFALNAVRTQTRASPLTWDFMRRKHSRCDEVCDVPDMLGVGATLARSDPPCRNAPKRSAPAPCVLGSTMAPTIRTVDDSRRREQLDCVVADANGHLCARYRLV